MQLQKRSKRPWAPAEASNADAGAQGCDRAISADRHDEDHDEDHDKDRQDGDRQDGDRQDKDGKTRTGKTRTGKTRTGKARAARTTLTRTGKARAGNMAILCNKSIHDMNLRKQHADPPLWHRRTHSGRPVLPPCAVGALRWEPWCPFTFLTIEVPRNLTLHAHVLPCTCGALGLSSSLTVADIPEVEFQLALHLSFMRVLVGSPDISRRNRRQLEPRAWFQVRCASSPT